MLLVEGNVKSKKKKKSCNGNSTVSEQEKTIITIKGSG